MTETKWLRCKVDRGMFSDEGISLYPGAPICQLIVEEVKGQPFRNDSQFQEQDRAGGHV
jgi:hypothetical protein